LISCSGELNLS